MKLNEYIKLFEKEYKAKIIDFSEVKKYFSRPDMYGNSFDIAKVSEREICSSNFVTLVIKGSNIDPNGHYDYGTKADLLFVEYDESKNVINTCLISSFVSKDSNADKKYYKLMDSYKES